MVRIRLRRVGAKKQPSYRVVVADQHKARDGRFIEIIGNYNPRTEPITMVIKGDRARYWLSQGAQPSDAVRRLLVKLAILDEKGKILEPAPEPVEEIVAEVAEPVAEVVEEAPVTEEEAEAEADEEEAAAEKPEAEEEAETEESDEA